MTEIKNIGDFLSLLRGVKQTGPGKWMAKCPAHDDQRASLSIALRDDRILVHCFAGCSTKDILRTLELEEKDLFLDHKVPRGKRIVCTYDYKDENGKLLYQICRTEPKKFFARRPDGHGGWIRGLGDVRRILYHLPELVKASPETPVFIVEGEKDADRLQREKLLAVTNPFGAGKWKGEWENSYNKALVGRHVIVLPDNDATGHKHGQEIARSLHGIAASVKVLELEGLPKKGDISDWLDQGHTAKELLALAETTPEWTPSKADRVPQEGNWKKEKRLAAPERLIQIARNECREFFTDTAGNPFTQIPIGEHIEIRPLHSSRFAEWVSNRYYTKTGKTPYPQALSAARLILASDCRRGPRRKLFNRVGWYEGAIWYDLCNESWEAIKISADGWEVRKDHPPLFWRYRHQLPQVTPVHGGKVSGILRFLNLPADKGLQLLTQVYLVATLVPDIPHPILVLTGPQGSAKSSFFKVLRTVIDPSITPTLALPHDENRLIQQLQHNWISYFDNVSFIPDWLSDNLCRAVTGEGASKRKLYSDDDDFVYSYRRVVGINGITNSVRRPDFMDRAIILKLERVTDEDRQSEKVLKEELDQELPGIFGGCLDALAYAIKNYPEMDLPQLPRMADFAMWGSAIAEGLGAKREDFLKVYHKNIEELNWLALEAQPFAQAVITLMKETPKWEGTASALLRRLEPLAQEKGIDVKSKDWPKNATWVRRRLDEAKANLAQAGITIQDTPSKGVKRFVLSRSDDDSE